MLEYFTPGEILDAGIFHPRVIPGCFIPGVLLVARIFHPRVIHECLTPGVLLDAEIFHLKVIPRCFTPGVIPRDYQGKRVNPPYRSSTFGNPS